MPSVNEYALWTVDSKGNFLTGSGALARNSFKLESAETTFNQDLNGDGVIGLNPIVIQTDTNAYGSTSLAELGNNYFLYAAGTTAGPELRYAGAAVIAGGRSIPIGAVETASGYEVAWKLPSVNEYALWTVDSKGNFLSGSGALAGNSFKLESAETTFNQDLNGDGVIGATPTAPVVSQQISSQTWVVGAAIDFALPANTFTDPQHENLTYSATLVGGGQLPSWLGFNGITGTFIGTVPNGTSGLNISVTATDTSGLSASETFSVVTRPVHQSFRSRLLIKHGELARPSISRCLPTPSPIRSTKT